MPNDSNSPLPDRFTCPRCGKTSWNLNDVRERYCGNYHAFVDDGPREFVCIDCGVHVASFGGCCPTIRMSAPNACGCGPSSLWSSARNYGSSLGVHGCDRLPRNKSLTLHV
jgi:hypothetical protein